MLKRGRMLITAAVAAVIVGGCAGIAFAASALAPSGSGNAGQRGATAAFTPQPTAEAPDTIASGSNSEPQANPTPAPTQAPLGGSVRDDEPTPAPAASQPAAQPDSLEGTVAEAIENDNDDTDGSSSVHFDELRDLAMALSTPGSDELAASGLSNVYSASVSVDDRVIYVAVATDDDLPQRARPQADGSFVLTIGGTKVVVVVGTEYPGSE